MFTSSSITRQHTPSYIYLSIYQSVYTYIYIYIYIYIYSSRRPPPVSLRLPSGSSSDPQTGAPVSARLDALTPACVCVPLDAAVTPCNEIHLDIFAVAGASYIYLSIHIYLAIYTYI